MTPHTWAVHVALTSLFPTKAQAGWVVRPDVTAGSHSFTHPLQRFCTAHHSSEPGLLPFDDHHTALTSCTFPSCLDSALQNLPTCVPPWSPQILGPTQSANPSCSLPVCLSLLTGHPGSRLSRSTRHRRGVWQNSGLTTIQGGITRLHRLPIWTESHTSRNQV